VHIHLAEGSTDREICKDRGWPDPLERLDRHGLVRPRSLLAHGVDLTPLDLQTIEEKGAWLVHNGRSNMNNGVGRAPVDRFPPRTLPGHRRPGRQHVRRAAHDVLRQQRSGRGPWASTAPSAGSAATSWPAEIFGEPFGSLDAGAPADFLIGCEDQKQPLHGQLARPAAVRHAARLIQEVWVDGAPRYRRGDPAPGRPGLPRRRQAHLGPHGQPLNRDPGRSPARRARPAGACPEPR
jgi:cytosine/adenosine deaminase-related metal-dependent hydrolase